MPARKKSTAKKTSGGSRKPPPVLDPGKLGRRLRAAREVAEFDSAEALARAVKKRFGIGMTARVIYSYEQGNTFPPLDIALMLVVMLKPPGGFQFFAGAIREDILAELEAGR